MSNNRLRMDLSIKKKLKIGNLLLQILFEQIFQNLMNYNVDY